MGSGCACGLARVGPSSPAVAARAALGSRPDAPAAVLPAAARMRARTEFSAAVRSGARAASPAVVVHVDVAGSGDLSPHVGFIVTRSVGNAVVRNRARRRLRHLMRARLDRLPAGSRVVVRVNPAAVGQHSVQLAAALDRALDRALAQVAAS